MRRGSYGRSCSSLDFSSSDEIYLHSSELDVYKYLNVIFIRWTFDGDTCLWLLGLGRFKKILVIL